MVLDVSWMICSKCGRKPPEAKSFRVSDPVVCCMCEPPPTGLAEAAKKSICDEARKAYSEYELTPFAKGVMDSFIAHIEEIDVVSFRSELSTQCLGILGRYVTSVIKDCPKR